MNMTQKDKQEVALFKRMTHELFNLDKKTKALSFERAVLIRQLFERKKDEAPHGVSDEGRQQYALEQVTMLTGLSRGRIFGFCSAANKKKDRDDS